MWLCVFAARGCVSRDEPGSSGVRKRCRERDEYLDHPTIADKTVEAGLPMGSIHPVGRWTSRCDHTRCYVGGAVVVYCKPMGATKVAKIRVVPFKKIKTSLSPLGLGFDRVG